MWIGLGMWLGVAGAGTAEDDRWPATLERVTQAVVSIRMDRPRAYDGGRRSNSQATGFVIDAERGLILTNRHVVTAGPTTAEALFLNHEEVTLRPLYRDPVHDFGVFAYDPGELRFIESGELALRPDKARVGTEIRVVGNDSGERLSILDGTLARLDRPAPVYGSDFNDFNTFYIQAASSTSGGSSGSPVVDVDGDVLALNAGGSRKAAQSFYLPLDRVERAVRLLQQGKPVPRGTLQTTFGYTSFADLKRLGLSAQSEAEARERAADRTGLLVAQVVLPKGPAAGRIELGDVLLSVEGTPIHDFVTLEALLDDAVGESISVTLERAGQPVTLDLTVGDLHAITPSEILEVGGGTVHALSYHQARTQQLAVEGLYLAEPGYIFGRAGIPTHAVIRELNGVPVTTVHAFSEAMATLDTDASFSVRWHRRGRARQLAETAVRMDRQWAGQRLCHRDDETGTWPCDEVSPTVGSSAAPARVQATLPTAPEKVARYVLPSLVEVQVDLPARIAGAAGARYTGGGLVVDAERGLVVVDRDTLPIALADVRVTIAGAIDLPGRVVAVHPIHNVAVVAYDPAQVPEVPVRSAVLSLEPLERGDSVFFVGMDGAQIDVQQVEVVDEEPFGIGPDGPPRFRESHVDVWSLRPEPPRHNGVIVDKRGRVGALWASFSYTRGDDTLATNRALPVRHVRDVLALARGETASRSLGWDLGTLPLPDALERGLPPAEADRLLAHDPDRRDVLQVVRVQRGDGLSEHVQPGDLVLAVGGTPVTRYAQIEDAISGRDVVALTVCRLGEVETVEVPTQRLPRVDIDRVLLWSGVRIHSPHRAATMVGVGAERPYIAWWESGSPAGRARVYPQRTIRSVDGVDVPDLDAFIEAVREVPDGTSLRLELETANGKRDVLTIEPDTRFWPTEELRWVDGQWVRTPL